LNLRCQFGTASFSIRWITAERQSPSGISQHCASPRDSTPSFLRHRSRRDLNPALLVGLGSRVSVGQAHQWLSCAMASAFAERLIAQFARTKNDAVAICDRIGPVFRGYWTCGRILRPVQIGSVGWSVYGRICDLKPLNRIRPTAECNRQAACALQNSIRLHPCLPRRSRWTKAGNPR